MVTSFERQCFFPRISFFLPRVEMGGFEPPTSDLQSRRSPPELHPLGHSLYGCTWTRTKDLSLIRAAL